MGIKVRIVILRENVNLFSRVFNFAIFWKARKLSPAKKKETIRYTLIVLNTTVKTNTFFPCVAGLISIVGLIGNCLVVSIIVSSRRRGQRSAVQLFLLHLAISDLLVCILCIPLTIWVNFYYPEEDQKGAGGVCKLARFVQVSMETTTRVRRLTLLAFSITAAFTRLWQV